MNLKKLLPFEDYTLVTTLSAGEVHQRIADTIEPKQVFRFSLFCNKATKPYEGILEENGFSMNRIMGYSNSMRIRIKGEISTFAGQTQILIQMKPATSVLVSIAIWLGTMGLVYLNVLHSGPNAIWQLLPTKLQAATPPDFIPFGLFIWGVVNIVIAFKIESKKTKRFLATLLNAVEIHADAALIGTHF